MLRDSDRSSSLTDSELYVRLKINRRPRRGVWTGSGGIHEKDDSDHPCVVRTSDHAFFKVHEIDKEAELHAAVGQAPIRGAAAVIVVTGMIDRAANARWIYLEGGHAAQNILLQAHSREIGAVVMGGFKDEDVRQVLNVPEGEHPVNIIPMGRKQDEKMP
jgi:nitroreductase